MNVARHYAVSKYCHTLMSATIGQTFSNGGKILFTCKYINPVGSSEANKVQAFFVMKFIFTTQSVCFVNSLSKLSNIIALTYHKPVNQPHTLTPLLLQSTSYKLALAGVKMSYK